MEEGSLALYKSHSHLPYIFYDGEWKYDQKNGKGEEKEQGKANPVPKNQGNFIPK